jgi:hypothetical protein
MGCANYEGGLLMHVQLTFNQENGLQTHNSNQSRGEAGAVAEGGFDFGEADRAPVAREVAVVGEGVDHGAGTAERGWGRGGVGAALESG